MELPIYKISRYRSPPPRSSITKETHLQTMATATDQTAPKTPVSPEMLSLTCTLCNKPAKLCSSCKSSSYCSELCQKKDWPIHKILCKVFSEVPTRPTPSHKLGILFPVDSKSPKLVWVPFEREVVEVRTGNKSTFVLPDVDGLVGYNPGSTVHAEQWIVEPERIKRARFIDYSIAVYLRTEFMRDGSKQNKSLKAVTKGTLKHLWRGPLLVVSMQGTPFIHKIALEFGDESVLVEERRAFPTSRDITLRDFRIACDYFMADPPMIVVTDPSDRRVSPLSVPQFVRNGGGMGFRQ